MSFLDWMYMNMFVDAMTVVFVFATIWKSIKFKKELEEMKRNLLAVDDKVEHTTNAVVRVIHEVEKMKEQNAASSKFLEHIKDQNNLEIKKIHSKIDSVIKNPQQAKRDLIKDD